MSEKIVSILEVVQEVLSELCYFWWAISIIVILH